MHMQRKKFFQALVSTAVCAAMFLGSISTVLAEGEPEGKVPQNNGGGLQSLTTADAVNLAIGDSVKYMYGADAVANMATPSAGLTSRDDNHTKLTDGKIGEEGKIAIGDSVILYTKKNASAPNCFDTSTVDFDLGEAKTVLGVNIISPKIVTGSSLKPEVQVGRTGTYSVFVSNDNVKWTPVAENQLPPLRHDEAESYVSSYSVENDKVAADKNATSIYARYVRIQFTNIIDTDQVDSSTNPDYWIADPAYDGWNGYYTTLEEIEILGQDGKAEGAFEPENAGMESLDATYSYSDSTVTYMVDSSDSGLTKLTDGKQGDTSGDLTDWAVFEPIPYMFPGASNYNNDPLCAIFDLGSKKSVTSVSANTLVNGEYKQSAHFQVWASNDKREWFPVVKQDGYDQVTTSGALELVWNGSDDGVLEQDAAINAVYTRYLKVVFSTFSGTENEKVALDEVVIKGIDGKLPNAIDADNMKPPIDPNQPDPNYPDNLAYGKSYKILNSSGPYDNVSYPDPNGTKLTDGEYGSTTYSDGKWVGWAMGDVLQRSIVLDLKETSSINEVVISLLYNQASAIRIPGYISLAFSQDNENWATLGEITLPETPVLTEEEKDKSILYKVSWKASEDRRVTKNPGQDTASISTRYIKITFPMANWTMFDEIRAHGVVGTTADSVELPTDDQKTYMQVGEQTDNIGDIVLLYNGYYADGSGDWAVEDCIPYLVHEDLETGEKDSMFDAVMFLGLTTLNGKHAFGEPVNAASAANVADFQEYLDKTLGKGGDTDNLNEAAKIAAQQLNDPNYKIKVVIMVPSVSTYQNDFGKIPGGARSLCFDPKLNPDGWEADQKTALEWYMNSILDMWDEGGFDHLELSGLYWLEEQINKQTVALKTVSDFTDAHDLKFHWIPYRNAAGYKKWVDWGFDAVAYQPNYSFTANPAYSILTDAATSAIAYSMGMELELARVESDGSITTDNFNHYMDYLEAGVDYGFADPDVYKAYYQSVRALLWASQSENPRVRYVYDATYDFIKGNYQKGYLQYLNESNVTANEVGDIEAVIENIETKLQTAEGDQAAYLNGQKDKLNALKDYVMDIRTDINNILDSFQDVTPDTITEEQKADLAVTVAKIRSYLAGSNLTDTQKDSLTQKLDELIALDPASYPTYTITIGTTKYGTLSASREKALEGEKITITATPVNPAFQLKEGSLKVNGTAITGNTFVMPAQNVTITAEFEYKYEVEPSPDPTPGGNTTVYVPSGSTETVSTAPAAIDTQSVVSDIKDSPQSTIQITLSKGAVVEPSIFAAAKENNKILVFAVEDSAGKLLYQWEFDGRNIAYPGIATSLGILFTDLASDAEMAALSGLDSGMVIDFLHAGTLPGTAQIAIRVSEKFADGDQLYFYYLNPSSGKLELIAKNLTVKGGYVVLPNRTHCSKYLLSNVAISGAEDKTSESSTTVNTGATKNPSTGDSTPVGLAVMLLASGAALLAVRKKQK